MTSQETPPRTPRPPGNGLPALWQVVIAGVVVVALLLLIVVVGVGLARDQLDVTGVATVLCTLISGIVLGTVLKGRDPK